MNDTLLSINIKAIDRASSVINKLQQNTDDASRKMRQNFERTSKALDSIGISAIKAGGAMTVGGLALGASLGLGNIIPQALEMEHRLREIGNVGNYSATQISNLGSKLGDISSLTNQTQPALLESINFYSAQGITNIAKLAEMTKVAGKVATGENAAILDIATTAYRVTDNLKVPTAQLSKTMDILAQSGKEGSFELKSMAQYFPQLTASAMSLGMKGLPAVSQLGAALQIAQKGAGDAGTAANNFGNFLQKIRMPDTVLDLQKLEKKGFKGLTAQWDSALKAKDPILEVTRLVSKLNDQGIKTTQIFQDKQVLDFVNVMIPNLKQYEQIKARSLSASGVVDKDYENMMSTTLEQWKLLKININEIVMPELAGPLKAVNNVLQKINANPMLQKGLVNSIIGLTGGGILLTAIGGATVGIGKLVGGYGDMIKNAKALTPILKQNTLQLLKFSGLNTTFHNIETASKLNKAGNPLGIDLSKFSFKSGIMADIKQLDNRMKSGIVRTFKDFKPNIVKSATALKDFGIASVKAVPTNFMNGLSSIKTGLSGMPSKIQAGIGAFRALSITLLTSPIGWIGLAIGAAAFLIYKYWKPITGFFRGVWTGIVEATKPLHPVFKRIGLALKPLFVPVQALFNWFKKLGTPVNDVGGKAESMGIKVGKAIGGVVVFVSKLVEKFADVLGVIGKIGNALMGLGGKSIEVKSSLPKHHTGLKTSSDEHLAVILKKERVLSPSESSNYDNIVASKSLSGNGGNITYSPNITFAGNVDEKTKDDFKTMLRQHKNEICNIVNGQNSRQVGLAY